MGPDSSLYPGETRRIPSAPAPAPPLEAHKPAQWKRCDPQPHQGKEIWEFRERGRVIYFIALRGESKYEISLEFDAGICLQGHDNDPRETFDSLAIQTESLFAPVPVQLEIDRFIEAAEDAWFGKK